MPRCSFFSKLSWRQMEGKNKGKWGEGKEGERPKERSRRRNCTGDGDSESSPHLVTWFWWCQLGPHLFSFSPGDADIEVWHSHLQEYFPITILIASPTAIPSLKSYLSNFTCICASGNVCQSELNSKEQVRFCLLCDLSFHVLKCF